MKEDYKVDPLSIKVDQTKRDTRRELGIGTIWVLIIENKNLKVTVH